MQMNDNLVKFQYTTETMQFSCASLTDGHISSGSHWAWRAAEDSNWLWVRPQVVSRQGHYSRIRWCCWRICIYPVSSATTVSWMKSVT